MESHDCAFVAKSCYPAYVYDESNGSLDRYVLRPRWDSGDAKETQVEKMGVYHLYYKICLLPVHNYNKEC